MKHATIIRHLALLLLVLCVFASCRGFHRSAHVLERQLHRQQQRAELLTQQLSSAILTNNVDSLRHSLEQEKDILFYIYHQQRLVYWSDSWLSAPYLPIREHYDVWQYSQWNNAQGICRITRVGDAQILTVIPVKYAYRVASANLNNEFIAPFRGDPSWGITQHQAQQDGSHPIYSVNGDYLFSLQRDAQPISLQNNIHIRNFSYQAILASEKHDQSISRSKLFMYYALTLTLIFILIATAIYHLIKSRGLRNMRLAGRLQLMLTPVMLLALASTFILSVAHTKQVYMARQQQQLQQKAHYIQLALQSMYYWDMDLTSFHHNALNVDLRDLSFDFETDIHVYDLQGQLLGSSCPELFELGIVSRYLAPEMCFTDSTQMIRYEQLGNVRHLSAYTQFVNGGFVQIGYVVIPSFISQEEMSAAVERFVVRLLPLYIMLLLVSILVVWLVARGVASPLSTISTQLKNYRLGEKGQHISYFFCDEVGNLIQHYNEMMDALAESTQRLARSEREGAWRTMARQVAHEIKNPLTPIKLEIQRLIRLKEKGNPKWEEKFDMVTGVVLEHIDILTDTANEFSTFAKLYSEEPVLMDLDKTLKDQLLIFDNKENIRIDYIGMPEAFVMAPRPQLIRVFVNLITNAIQAVEIRQKEMEEHGEEPIRGKVLIALRHSIRDGYYDIVVNDNGSGVKEENLDKLFTPNFTTKSGGTGLGLAICRNIIEKCDGTISYSKSFELGGASFTVTLPKI